MASEVTLRRVLVIAMPMMLAHATTPLLGLVGATAIGRLGQPALLGAVALGAVIFDLLFWTFGALRMATAGLTAQAFGAGESYEIDRLAARGLILAGLIGILIVALQHPIGRTAFALAGASEAVNSGLAVYFGIRVWAAPFTLANYAILGSVLGRGRTDLGLLLQVAINLVNVALTLLLVMVWDYGIAGAAIAPLFAEAAGTLLGFAVLSRVGSHPFRVPLHGLLDRTAALRMLLVNRDIMIRTLALVLAYAVFAAEGARAGDVTLAANAILQNLWLTAGYVLDGFATAAETLCGQALGARNEARFRRAVRLALGCCFGVGAVLSALFLAGGAALVDFVSTSSEVREEARRFLVLAALTPLASAAAFTFDGVFIGATWTRPMRDLMLASFGLYLAIVWAGSSLGNTGLWLAMLAFLVRVGSARRSPIRRSSGAPSRPSYQPRELRRLRPELPDTGSGCHDPWPDREGRGHEHEGAGLAYNLAVRLDKIALFHRVDELCVELNGDLAPAAIRHPRSHPERVVGEGHDHAAMHSALPVQVPLLGPKAVNGPAPFGFHPKRPDHGHHAVVPRARRPTSGSWVDRRPRWKNVASIGPERERNDVPDCGQRQRAVEMRK
jgi:MATE family multidrug resistance protein